MECDEEKDRSKCLAYYTKHFSKRNKRLYFDDLKQFSF